MTPSTDTVDPILALGAIVAALLAGLALAAPLAPRLRALASLGALLLTPVLLLVEIWDSDQIEALRDRPAVAGAAAVVGVVFVVGLAVLFARRPSWLPIAAVAALPFRIPIAAGGTTSSLLVPLYAVIAAGVLAYAVPRLLGRVADDGPDAGGVWVRRLLAGSIVLYAVQASYTSDFERALQQVVFFYVPFALLAGLLLRVEWSREVLVRCLGTLAGLAVVFVAIGYWEYATRTLLLNPKVIASNQFETYFRVNSLFFDPNIYGRFLAVVMLLLTSVVLWTKQNTRLLAGLGVLLAFLWGGLLLTLSQSSFAALLAGLAVLAVYRWGTRRALVPVAVILAVGVVGAVGFAVASGGIDDATTGRWSLVKGGLKLAQNAPVQGNGSASFRREYRREENASGEKATNASHNMPVTIAAEQGLIGLAVYLALLVVALALLLRGAGGSIARTGIAAAFVALQVHTMAYAAFLEDPLAWALLAAGIALGAAPRRPS